jgi:hypothetical protein
MYPHEDDKTVITSNTGSSKCGISNNTPPPQHFAYAAFPLKMKYSIADSGAMQIFIMKGTPVINKRPTTCPLVVSLADGSKVTSTHMCNIHRWTPGGPHWTHHPGTLHRFPFLALSYLLRLDVKDGLINHHARCGITIGSYSKVVKIKLPTYGGYQLVKIQACPPITMQLRLRRRPLLVSLPMLSKLQHKLCFPRILFETKQIASGLHINLYAARIFLPFSKLSDAAS